MIVSLKLLRSLAPAVCAAILLGCSLFPESSFHLSDESRLPRWFSIPPGKSRADVTVQMTYYIDFKGRRATFELIDKARNRTLAKMHGTQRGSQPIELKNPPPGFPEGYPSYGVITAGGMTEVIEHRRMEPVFYITDDPAILRELGVAASR